MFAEIKDSSVVTYPFDYEILVNRNPNTSFPSDMRFVSMYEQTPAFVAGNVLVQISVQNEPTYDKSTQKLILANNPSLIDGKWVLAWSVEQMNTDERTQANSEKAKSVREKRDEKLKQTDWKVIKAVETNITLSSEWATYRQALRDITAQSGFPWTITWPDAP